jgi:hypothetical protein
MAFGQCAAESVSDDYGDMGVYTRNMVRLENSATNSQFSYFVSLTYRHNMDMTETFMLEASEMFVRENLPRFVLGKELLNPVDTVAGY